MYSAGMVPYLVHAALCDAGQRKADQPPPGMAVTVEVKTGARRIIEYLLSPVLRYKDESIQER